MRAYNQVLINVESGAIENAKEIMNIREIQKKA
jgi:hypothetical protein